MGISLLEIVLSAWILASPFAGSPRYASCLTRNVAAPAVTVVRFWSSRLLPVKCLHLVLLLKLPFRLHLTIFLQSSAALGCCTNKAWGLSQGCHVTIMPRPRLLVPDSSSWSLPLRVPLSSDTFSFWPTDSHTLLPLSPLFEQIYHLLWLCLGSRNLLICRSQCPSSISVRHVSVVNKDRICFVVTMRIRDFVNPAWNVILMMMIAFITISSVVPWIEGLHSLNSNLFRVLGFTFEFLLCFFERENTAYPLWETF